MATLKAIAQQFILLTCQPIIHRELPGWGLIYKCFVGNQSRNKFWRGSQKRTIRGKFHGYLMELDLSHWSDRLSYFLGRWYDLATQLLLKDIIKPGDEVVDIGANVGNFTLCANYLVGKSGKVYSFEPNPTVRAKLNNHIAINAISNTTIYPFGLSDSVGTMTLYIPHVNAGEGSLGRFTDSEYTSNDYDEVPVEIKVGDDILKDSSPRVVKIDVEGAEVSVLNGLTKLISQHKPLIIAEHIPQHLARFGQGFQQLFAFAQLHDYTIYKLTLIRKFSVYGLAFTPIALPTFNDDCDILMCHKQDIFNAEIARKLL
jgi:FkbM family methyltransferase